MRRYDNARAVNAVGSLDVVGACVLSPAHGRTACPRRQGATYEATRAEDPVKPCSRNARQRCMTLRQPSAQRCWTYVA